MNEITSLFGSLFNSSRWHQQAITKLTTPFSSFVTWASLLQGKPWGSDFMIQVISYFLGHGISRVQISLHFI